MGKRKQTSTTSSKPALLVVDNTTYTEASTRFKITNIRRYFENGALSKPQDIESPSVGPGKFTIQCATEKGISVFFRPIWTPSDIRLSVTYEITLTVSTSPSLRTASYYETRSFKYTWTAADQRFRGDHSLVSLDDWKANKSLRIANCVYLLAEIKSFPQSAITLPSAATLGVLYRTISATESPTCRFTVFRHQDASGKLSDRRTLSMDLKTIQARCTTLDSVLSGQSHWDGLCAQCPPDEKPARNCSYSDSDFEDDIDYDTDDAGRSDDEDHLGDQTSLGNVGRSHPVEDIDDDSDDSSSTSSSESAALSASLKKAFNKPVAAQTNTPQASQPHREAGPQDRQSVLRNYDAPMEVDCEAQNIRTAETANSNPNLNAVVIGAASTTWEAFLFYLHTGIVQFAPLTSTGRKRRAAYIKKTSARDRPRPCSPKSMYRLADTMKMAALKQLCLNEIRNQLSVRNILAELLSTFTSDYDEVKEIELQVLVQHSSKIMGSTALSKIMIDVAKGAYPHAGELLAEAWRRVGGASFNPQ